MMDTGTTMWNTRLLGLPSDVTYLWANNTLVFADGADATITGDVYLHHLGIYDLTRPGKALTDCPGLTPATPSLFTGAGEDRGETFFTSPDGGFGSGYFVGRKDVVMSMGMAVNYGKEKKEVYSRVEVEYVDGRIEDALEVSIQTVSVTGCGLDLGIVPKATDKHLNLTSRAFPVMNDGYLVGAKGHLHDGGDNLILKVNNVTVCDSKAVYGGAASTAKMADGTTWETINHMTQCQEPVPVKKGDVLTVHANYDFVLHPS